MTLSINIVMIRILLITGTTSIHRRILKARPPQLLLARGRGLPTARLGGGRDAPVLAAALDALVAVLVQSGKVLPELAVVRGHGLVLGHLRELQGEVFERRGVELVLVGLSKR